MFPLKLHVVCVGTSSLYTSGVCNRADDRADLDTGLEHPRQEVNIIIDWSFLAKKKIG